MPVADFPVDLLARLLDEAAELGFSHLALTGGEPALHPQFDLVVEKIVAANFTWSLVTNGSHIEWYKTAIGNFGSRLTYVAVSIDGATAEVHDAQRMPNSFAKACAGLSWLKEQKVYTRIAFLVSPHNHHQVPLVANLATSLGVDSVNFLGIIPSESHDGLNYTIKKKVYKQIRAMKENLRMNIRNATSLYLAPRSPCQGLIEHEPALNPFGEYLLCCDTFGRGAVIGQLASEAFDQLYIKGLKLTTRKRKAWEKLQASSDDPKELNPCLFCSEEL